MPRTNILSSGKSLPASRRRRKRTQHTRRGVKAHKAVKPPGAQQVTAFIVRNAPITTPQAVGKNAVSGAKRQGSVARDRHALTSDAVDSAPGNGRFHRGGCTVSAGLR